ncbi:MAG: hypothetical protein JSV49_04315, partial [Thermoplasmata archaeon]
CMCRMLNLKELPIDLLERYEQVKMLVDRVDAHLNPGDLALIILSSPYSPDIATVLAEDDDEVIEEAVEPDPEAAAGENPPERPANGIEYEGADNTFLKQPVSGVTGQAIDKKVPDMSTVWSPGMPVQVLHNDELKQGKIVGTVPPAKGKALQLTVEMEDGETETFDEEDVEAV